jgi:hypothetical protein
MSGEVDFARDESGAGASAPLAIPVKFSHRTRWGTPVPIDPHPLGVDVRLGDVYITGPGTLAVEGSIRIPIDDHEALLQIRRLGVQLILPVAGGVGPSWYRSGWSGRLRSAWGGVSHADEQADQPEGSVLR